MNTTTINARIKYIREQLCNNSNVEFAKRLGKETNTTSNWVREGYSVGKGVASDISRAFPQVDLDWLLTGEGDMLKPTPNTYNKNIANTHGSGNQITQMNDLVIGGGVSNIGNRNNGGSAPQNELEKRYKARIIEIEEGCAVRISEMEKKCEALLAAKDELIKELKLQNERANKTIEILCDKR